MPPPGGGGLKVRKAVRIALTAMVERGESIPDAARAAGLSERGLRQSLLKHTTRAYYSQLRTEFVERMTAQKDLIAAQAIMGIVNIAEKAVSEHARLKALEFLARIGQTIKAQPLAPPAPATVGYAYQRPAPDGTSGDEDEQPIGIPHITEEVGK
jgi:hypothetical protein